MEMYNPPHPGETLKGFHIKEHKLSIAKITSMLGLSHKHCETNC